MPSINKLFVSVFLAVVYASTALAVPWPSHSKLATHHARVINRDVKLSSFYPASTFEPFGAGIDHPMRQHASEDIKSAAISFAQSHLGLDDNTVEFQSGFSSDTTQHAYLNQFHDGVPFANAVANVAFDKDNKVVSFSSSFVKPKSLPSSKPAVSLQDAIVAAEEALDGKHNDHKPTLEYLALEDGSVALTHVVQIRDEDKGIWKEAFVDAHTKELRGVTDFVAKASYRVVPITKQDPTEGFELLTDPQDTTASPNGWHKIGATTYPETSGNNVISYKGITYRGRGLKQTTKESSLSLNFDYKQDPNAEPTTATNLDAARTNAFYVVNTVHDIAYKYGFTEAAFNFQYDNFGKGGNGNDRVSVSVQDIAGKNNADFTTPPDGQPGAMRMYLWDITKPGRDGALENDIVVHENTHGITNRMTGGEPHDAYRRRKLAVWVKDGRMLWLSGPSKRLSTSRTSLLVPMSLTIQRAYGLTRTRPRLPLILSDIQVFRLSTRFIRSARFGPTYFTTFTLRSFLRKDSPTRLARTLLGKRAT
jgi:extracellular elastinolytic metalloproteinase